MTEDQSAVSIGAWLSPDGESGVVIIVTGPEGDDHCAELTIEQAREAVAAIEATIAYLAATETAPGETHAATRRPQ